MAHTGLARFAWVRLMAALAFVMAMAAFAFAAPAAAQAESVEVTLDELNDSGMSGFATLTAANGQTVVSVDVTGAIGDHPAHIHVGTCDDLDPNPQYPLNDVDADGFSDTTVDVSLDDLLAGEFAINVHLSVTEIGTYVTCGNITGDPVVADEVVTDEPAAAEIATVDMGELNDSGITGISTLTTDGVSTEVLVELAGDAVVGDHPAHIHFGTCDDLDPNPEYPLSDVDASGVSQTSVPVSLDELVAGEYAINVHLSAAEIGVYVACGEITELGVGGTVAETVPAAEAPTTAPATGVGTAFRDGSNSAMIGLLGALVVALAAGGLALRYREVRA